MKNFQTKLDVIGNNIANVNTYGFKKGRVVFQDMLSQNLSGASAATSTRGGVNSKQVGLGSQLAAIDTIQTSGSTQTTGRTLDLSISGDGYFVVAEAMVKPGTGDNDDAVTILEKKYTRAGNFYLDKNGYLINSEGLYVLGYESKETDADQDSNTGNAGQNANQEPKSLIKIPTDAKDISIGPDGKVSFIPATKTSENGGGEEKVGDGDGDVTQNEGLSVAGTISFAKFANSGGLQKSASNLFTPTSNSGDAIFTKAGEGGTGTVASSTLEMSNVDLSEEFTEMIVAQRGFQANTKIITTSDEILQELVNLKR